MRGRNIARRSAPLPALLRRGGRSPVVGGGAPAYNPLTALPNLRLALDAATVTLVGSDVDVWPDQSGLAQDFSAASAGVRPLYAATGFNSGSQPYVESDGVSEWLRRTSFSFGVTPFDTYTIIEVGQSVTYVGGDYIWSGPAVFPRLRQLVGPTRLSHEARSGTPITIANSTTPRVTFSTLAAGLSTRIRINNGTESTTANLMQSFTDGGAFALFARSDTGGSAANHRIAAFYICRSVLTTQEQDAFYAYAATRWGV